MRITLGLLAFCSTGLLGCSGNSDSPDAAPPLSKRDTAIAALHEIYVDKDTGAIDRYFDPAFIRHDPSATADGTAAFKAQVAANLAAITFTSFRAYQEGDVVVVHDEYDNVPAAGAHTIGFDLFRFSGDTIAEHWTCRQSDPGTYASGHTMVDGPTASDPAADTAASEDVVVTPGKGFVPVVIIGGDFPHLSDFLSPDFAQHDPLLADGIMGLGVGFAQPPLNTLRDFAIPESVGEHDLVFTRSKGTMTWDAVKPNSPDNPTVFCDLFHVQGGKITEHWDVIQLDPNSTSIDDVQTNGAGHTLWE